MYYSAIKMKKLTFEVTYLEPEDITWSEMS